MRVHLFHPRSGRCLKTMSQFCAWDLEMAFWEKPALVSFVFRHPYDHDFRVFLECIHKAQPLYHEICCNAYFKHTNLPCGVWRSVTLRAAFRCSSKKCVSWSQLNTSVLHRGSAIPHVDGVVAARRREVHDPGPWSCGVHLRRSTIKGAIWTASMDCHMLSNSPFSVSTWIV